MSVSTTVIARRQSDGDAARNLRQSPFAAAETPRRLVTLGMSLAADRADEDDQIGLEIMLVRADLHRRGNDARTVCRTANSLIISESKDFANEILDRTGKPRRTARALPVFNRPDDAVVQACSSQFPTDNDAAGDVLSDQRYVDCARGATTCESRGDTGVSETDGWRDVDGSGTSATSACVKEARRGPRAVSTKALLSPADEALQPPASLKQSLCG